MSIFALKLIALITMLIDHAAYVFAMETLMPFNIASIIRGIPRIAFPLFAFAMVIGCEKTSNPKLYLKRIIQFAVISIIPFNLTFSEKVAVGTGIWFVHPWYLCVLAAVAIAAAWYFTVLRDWSAVWLGVLIFASMIRLSIGSVFLLANMSSVISNLAVSLAAIMLIKRIEGSSYKDPKLLLQIPAFLLSAYIIIPNSDYSYCGPILTLLLYFVRNKKPWLRSAVVLLWGIAIYAPMGIMGVYYAAMCIIAGILISLYNGEQGRRAQRLFYYFYPAHLALLGIFKIIH